MKWTYRKVKNRGFTPSWYHTDHGCRAGFIEKEGTKWMYFRFADDTRKRIALSEKRYITEMKSRRG